MKILHLLIFLLLCLSVFGGIKRQGTVSKSAPKAPSKQPKPKTQKLKMSGKSKIGEKPYAVHDFIINKAV